MDSSIARSSGICTWYKIKDIQVSINLLRQSEMKIVTTQ